MLSTNKSFRFEDIAYRFEVNKGTVSRHFHSTLEVLHVKTKPLIVWPDREVLRLTMPTPFRKFFKQCAVVNDCMEVVVERRSDLLARAQVWSNYKHHSTYNFLLELHHREPYRMFLDVLVVGCLIKTLLKAPLL